MGLAAQIRSLPAPFWIANTMEIFERMAWYGFFALSSLYMTGSIETGGLGFTSEQRGAIQAIIPFLLYLMPVLTGALADRYGYKKMFLISYALMVICYYALGQFKTLGSFMIAFFGVAVAAAIFKPVVVGTVARTTREGNSRLGFGIFYMMVNIGGFFGPLVAGLVRGKWDWSAIFIASASWAAINLFICLFFYREPVVEGGVPRRTFRQVMANTYEVLGNARLGLIVLGVLIALMLANLEKPWFTWQHCGYFIPIWIIANFLWDALLPKGSGRPETASGRPWFLQRTHCSNWRFALFLLILSGFWTSYNQIFLTAPEYIRDFVETRPLTNFVGRLAGQDAADTMASINASEQAEITRKMQRLFAAPGKEALPADISSEVSQALLASKVRVDPVTLEAWSNEPDATAESVAARAIAEGRQFNPEYIINLNSLAIVLFQVIVSFALSGWHQFPTMIVGMLVAAVGLAFPALEWGRDAGFAYSVWLVAAGIGIFAFGEMMASPTSQEYVGRIAPPDKKAVYMGYYFVAVALGNLFGGILSGQLYGKFARDMQRPDLMWLIFGGIMLGTAIVFLIYNRLVAPATATEQPTATPRS